MALETLTITGISRNEKQGSKGAYISLGIKTEEYGDRWLNGFGNKTNDNWNKGDKVEVIVEEKDVNGKKYLNFSTPKKEDKMNEGIEEIAKDIKAVRTMTKAIGQFLKIPAFMPPVDARDALHANIKEDSSNMSNFDDIDLNSIPF